jgi:hypothetical protein
MGKAKLLPKPHPSLLPLWVLGFITHTHRSKQHLHGKKMWHFICPVRIPKNGILKSKKSFRILTALSSDMRNFTFKYPKRATNVSTFSVSSCADLCESAKAAKRATLLMACKVTYKWNFSNLKKVPETWRSQDFDTEFCKSKESARILGISGYYTFFRFTKFHL